MCLEANVKVLYAKCVCVCWFESYLPAMVWRGGGFPFTKGQTPGGHLRDRPHLATHFLFACCEHVSCFSLWISFSDNKTIYYWIWCVSLMCDSLLFGNRPKRLPQVFVPPRQCTDHWRHFEGGRQALVNIKSAPPAIPFDTPVTGKE